MGTPVSFLTWLIHEVRGRPLGFRQPTGTRRFMEMSLLNPSIALHGTVEGSRTTWPCAFLPGCSLTVLQSGAYIITKKKFVSNPPSLPIDFLSFFYSFNATLNWLDPQHPPLPCHLSYVNPCLLTQYLSDWANHFSLLHSWADPLTNTAFQMSLPTKYVPHIQNV